ncbi:cell division protein ZipA [Acinetobacter sp. NCu2D-2]|uniref:cell division protein ZipA C-terminal FtsZ-binding domain-containing protein n=1 Tax=Acinetobacter sp. NCu2D-2 TaxID=1608473 RepID=UPI0007CDA0F3|nr:cell division protein ZipA C-terminal FtsZ-binding domain-containing protein [Acinetobacter sp. NCu2D-2]ANF81163.1 cell division protein ZipA [Acinetobacter sp. NCu2D-2]
MEITTIIGIVIAVVIMLLGIKMIIKKPNDEPSLDAELHIDPDSQMPVIPRHVRGQLVKEDAVRVEPTLAENTDSPSDQKEPTFIQLTPDAVKKTEQQSEAAPVKEPVEEVVAEKAPVSDEKVVEAVNAADVKEETVEPSKEAEQPKADFSLNTHIEKAEISEFDEESSILEAHLYEQKIVDEESALANAETVISLHIYPQGRVLSGEKTLKVLLKYGLRYGELACFHRYSEDGSKLLFSVLQVTDTGMEGFDLETLSTEEVKGLAFFLALPHTDVQNAFDTMDSISRLIAREVDGVVYDQNHQEFTPQLREFWRHQAIDYRAGQAIEV